MSRQREKISLYYAQQARGERSTQCYGGSTIAILVPQNILYGVYKLYYTHMIIIIQ